MNLFKRREQTHPDLAAALERLDQLAQASPSFQEAAALQSAILRTIYTAPPPVGAFTMTQAQAAEKLGGAIPLLRGEDLPLDMRAVQALMLRLCKAIQDLDGAGGAAHAIAAAIDRGALDVTALVRDALDGRAIAIRELAGELGLDPDLLCTLLRFTLLPALEQLAAQLAPLRAAAAWRHGYCPMCGSWPLLGEHRGLEQTRFLRCGLCASEWAVDRLFCPFCTSRDHADLGYLHVEGDQHKRAVTCEHCRGYIKVLATLAAIPPIELPVQDLATLHLDMVALEQGYAPPM